MTDQITVYDLFYGYDYSEAKKDQQEARQNVQAGDEVILYRSGRYGKPSTFTTVKVERTTKTLIILDQHYSNRYYKADGQRQGKSSRYSHSPIPKLIVPTEIALQAIENEKAENAEREAKKEAEARVRQAAKNLRDDRFWVDITQDEVNQIADLIKQLKAARD